MLNSLTWGFEETMKYFKSIFISDIIDEGAICSTISTKSPQYSVTRTIHSHCVIAKFTIYYQVYPYIGKDSVIKFLSPILFQRSLETMIIPKMYIILNKFVKFFFF